MEATHYYIPKGTGYFIAEFHGFRRAQENTPVIFQEEHEGKTYCKLMTGVQIYVHAGKLKEYNNEQLAD